MQPKQFEFQSQPKKNFPKSEKRHLTPAEQESKSFKHKERGNAYFKAQNYSKAIQHYTKAISLNQTNSIFYYNRALCLKYQEKLNSALVDTSKALEINSCYVKALNLHGQLLCLKGKHAPTIGTINRGIEFLKKAVLILQEALRTQSTLENQGSFNSAAYKQFLNDIEASLQIGKRIKWYKERDIANIEKAQLSSYLEQLVIRKSEPSQKEKRLEQIKEVFKLQDEKSSIKDHIIDPIGFEIFKNPVVNSEGFTYERNVLKEVVKFNGNIDPITRKPFSQFSLYPNRAIKLAATKFLEENPWVTEKNSFPNEDYNQIKF